MCLLFAYVSFTSSLLKIISTPGRFLEFLSHLLESIRNQELAKNLWKSSRETSGTPWLLSLKALNCSGELSISEQVWTGRRAPDSTGCRQILQRFLSSTVTQEFGLRRDCAYGQISIHTVHRLKNQALLRGGVDTGIPPTSPRRASSSSV